MSPSATNPANNTPLTYWQQVKADLAAERAGFEPVPTHTHPYLQQAVIKDFNGSNHRELALKYDLTVATIYAITRRGTARPKLTGDSKPLTRWEQAKADLAAERLTEAAAAWSTGSTSAFQPAGQKSIPLRLIRLAQAVRAAWLDF
jgi:hypothetical protein